MPRKLNVLVAAIFLALLSFTSTSSANTTFTDHVSVSYDLSCFEAELFLACEPGTPFVVFDSIGLTVGGGVTDDWEHSVLIPLPNGGYVADVLLGEGAICFSFLEPELEPDFVD